MAAEHTLTIQGFQGINHAVVPLKGFTAITGPSNKGKSSIIRAWDSLLFNTYLPAFLREGAEETVLEWKGMIPGSEIIRINLTKSSKVNTYEVEFADGSVKRFPKTGRLQTPDEMKDAGIDYLTTERGDKHNLIIQGQLEPTFLMGPAQGEVIFTSFFNRLFQVDRFERGQRKIEAEINTLNKEMEGVGGEITDLGESITMLEYRLAEETASVERLQEAVSRLEGVQARIDRIRQAQASVGAAVEAVTQSVRGLERANTLRGWIQSIDSFVSRLNQVQAIWTLGGRLYVANQSLQQIVEQGSKAQLRSKVLSITESHIAKICATKTGLQDISEADQSSKFSGLALGNTASKHLALSEYEDRLTRVLSLIEGRQQMESLTSQVSVTKVSAEKSRSEFSILSQAEFAISKVFCISEFIKTLGQAREFLTSTESAIQQKQVEHQESEQAFQSILELVGTCPLCGVQQCQHSST